MNTCIAYREDGRICGRPAFRIDHQRGGMVCAEHAARADWNEDDDRRMIAEATENMKRRVRSGEFKGGPSR